MGIFDSYIWESSFDEMYDAHQNIRPAWQEVFDAIENAQVAQMQTQQSQINWHLEDNGVTYNMYDDDDKATHRSWRMDPIPFVIEEQEWGEISRGLEQRATLFNLILKDLYSEQKLIKENIIPAEVIFGHKGFATEVFNFGKKEHFNLHFYATDIARGPDGKMWVISDKTQAPSGLGYAIENRLTMNSVAQTLYPHIKIKKLASFLDDFKSLLEELTGGDIQKAGLLTPGPYNETYFEHAYLSAYFNINILQGQDLLSKDGALWMKTFKGLQPITTLLRRVDDRFCDPLELKNDSQLGVAGMVNALRQDTLNMVNPIGAAILENIGLNPFMEKIADYFLGEKLLLPQIATWWCGQKKELDFVLENLNTLVIKKIDRTRDIKVYFVKDLCTTERETLVKLLQKEPSKYVAQEYVDFSTVPFYEESKIEPRNAVIRSFALRKKGKYSVMNGGLVRVASSKDTLWVSSQSGGLSKDLWILGKDNYLFNPISQLPQSPYVATSIEQISTLKAENLFWLGRYLSRSLTTNRLISYLIKKITNFYRYEITTTKESQHIMENTLTHMTMTYPGFMNRVEDEKLDIFPMIEITSVIKDRYRIGSLASTIAMLSSANMNLKDLLTLESRKLFDRLEKEWYLFTNRQNDSTLVVANELDNLHIYLLAYKELVKESIFKEQGLVLYQIGYKMEDALLLISKAKSMLCFKLEKSIEYDILEGMLKSMESYNAYRAHYRSSLTLENTIEFLIFNRQFPKSLLYIIETLLLEFEDLPKSKRDFTPYQKHMQEAKALLEATDTTLLLEIEDEDSVYIKCNDMLSQLSNMFLACSNAFSNTYFAHYGE